MDQYSFQGFYAYRWIDDIPVERIDLRSGERRPLTLGAPGPVQPGCGGGRADPVRAAMAAWN
ncbi:MAG: hypothetical protein VKI83_01625 [Synechococcaceae cyanobacterium]|nr:hypothetical protein [Synechococcaceae cyanobacterium]